MTALRDIALPFDGGAPRTQSSVVRGGKGIGLAKMTALGLPVPPGFTIPTSVCRAYLQYRRVPQRLDRQVMRQLRSLERHTGRTFGDPSNPLLVSVRSGALRSMPGMMDTVLNVGLNQSTLDGLARQVGTDAALDCYRRFLTMYGETVARLGEGSLGRVAKRTMARFGVSDDAGLTGEVLRAVCVDLSTYLRTCPVPEDPYEQLRLAIYAVLESWMSQRAVAYRKSQGIPEGEGTAVNVQAMVLGNRDDRSATGVVFSRDVATGTPGLYGEFLVRAQGEDVVAGTRTPLPVRDMETWNPVLFAELERHVGTVAAAVDDIVDIEFTIESGKLWILQFRKAKRTPLAAVTYAVHRVWDGSWRRGQACKGVSFADREALLRPSFEPSALEGVRMHAATLTGTGASPGAAVGYVATSSEAAQAMAAAGKSVILVREDTSPSDLPGMLVSAAIVTATGGATSHAAVVARELGLPAVVGTHSVPGYVETDVLSVDGGAGLVVAGELPLVAPTLTKEVSVFRRWTEGLPYRPRIAFETIRPQKAVSPNLILNDFYVSAAMARATAGTGLESVAGELHRSIRDAAAERFAAYLALAVGGELRHCRIVSAAASPAGRHERKVQDQLTGRFGLLLNGTGETYRSAAQDSVAAALRRKGLGQQARFFQLAQQAFLFPDAFSSTSYGGQAWADIARAVSEFLSGNWPPGVFVDHVFDLRHNGGVLFNKRRHMIDNANEHAIVGQLNVKKSASSLTDLVHRLAEWGLSSPVRSLFDDGVGEGLWPQPPSGPSHPGEWCSHCQGYHT